MIIAVAAMFVWAASAHGQGAPPDTTTGFVIDDPLILRRCGGCHAKDSTGRVSRLSYMRKTPEGWETSVRRMVSLNNVRVTPVEARAIVKYLANRQGLAPAELAPGRFETERRMIDYRYEADAVTDRTCHACHSLGRVITQRRTRDEWKLLVATHRGYYPNSDFQAFRRGSPPPPDSAGAPQPMDQAIAHLSRAFPLRTPQWAAWSANMRPAPLEGTWILSGHEVGRGSFYGKMVVTKVPGESDEFTTHATFRFADGSAPVVRDGRAVVYTGHQWRGRSATPGTPSDSSWREVVSVEPGWQQMSGRWFRGGYDEFGMDVSLRRAGSEGAIAGVAPAALRAGTSDAEVTIHGLNLPTTVGASAIDFGPGVTVTRVVRATAEAITLRVKIDDGAPSGRRDLVLGTSSMPGALVVFGKVDRIRVAPLAALARVGGIRFPKQFVRFEAIGMLNGLDGKPETDDDVEIGPVGVAWGIEEYGVTYRDDDVAYVGTIDQAGLFTPNIDGPNPQRKGSRNNVGDVWVTATYKDAAPNGQTLRARAHLVVTVPLYMRWDPTRSAP